MGTHEEQAEIADANRLYLKMLANKRVVLSGARYDNLIDRLESRPRRDELNLCSNRQRCGIQDEYIAWIGTENKPLDLKFGESGSLCAVGSKYGKAVSAANTLIDWVVKNPNADTFIDDDKILDTLNGLRDAILDVEKTEELSREEEN